MKSLNEYLVLELKADTYKSAYQKASAKGDERAEKFLQAYIKALKEETPKADELNKKITNWVKEDKPLVHKLSKSSEFKFIKHQYYFSSDPKSYSPDIECKFLLCNCLDRQDDFFFRFTKNLRKEIPDKIANSHEIPFDIFSDKNIKEYNGKRFAVICGSKERNNYYIYLIDDKKLIYVKSNDDRTEEKDVTEFIENTIKKIGI